MFPYPINTDIIGNQANRSNQKRAETRFFVVHETVSVATARQQLAFFNTHNVSANAHAFIDWNEVLLTLPVDEIAWSVGQPANNFTFNVELCHTNDPAQFAKEWDIATRYAAKWCIDGNKDSMTFIKSHDEIRREFGGTDHTDPNAYFAQFGKTMDDFRREVAAIVEAERNPQPKPHDVPKTPIFGKSTATVEQMREYLKQKNPDAPDYAQLYLDIGAKYGIRGDLAFCQSIKETGAWKFGGQVKPDQNNFAGLGATNGGASGASFQTPAEGIEAQIQHLWGYATTDDLPSGTVVVDPRFDLLAQVGKRGSAPNWEDLNGKWAVPGNGYGESIVSMWKEMCEIETPKKDGVTEKAIELIKQVLEELKRRG